VLKLIFGIGIGYLDPALILCMLLGIKPLARMNEKFVAELAVTTFNADAF
jgi:hypothetical protein